MVRGGRMFAPTKIWRRWHRRVNVNQRRFAVVSALAASAIPSLVMARGHRVESVPELPLIISDSAEAVEKTSSAIKILKEIGAYPDAEKAKDSHQIRPGKGKMRNRRYVSRKGPLIVYGTEGSKIVRPSTTTVVFAASPVTPSTVDIAASIYSKSSRCPNLHCKHPSNHRYHRRCRCCRRCFCPLSLLPPLRPDLLLPVSRHQQRPTL